ncbi:MAG: DNA-binding protein WhiA [Lachnospiraceae bacterium]|nr:DNA-binding protein WhiA [Lachnospiraceae bacterium]
MSFSEEVKQELSGILPKAAHCISAELYSLNRFETRGAGKERIEKRKAFLDRRGTHEPRFDRRKDCCRRAYLRGAFLSAGSITDPARSYQLEFSLNDEELLNELTQVLSELGLSPKTVQRKNRTVLYFKEGEEIADLLNLCGAHQALMAFENARIVRDVRNTLNRRVNCETANLEKTASASVKQLKDIRRIENTIGLSSLAKPLREAAELRLMNPELPLSELGNLFSPPLGKSGVRHRLQKISDIAEKLEGKK